MWPDRRLPHADDMNITSGAQNPAALRPSASLSSAPPPPAPPVAGARAAVARQGRTPWLGIALIAAVAFGLELAVSARYGYVRDELYFLAAGHHLAFGYVDQPSLTPLLARISSTVTGNTLVGLRVLPALALAAFVVAT